MSKKIFSLLLVLVMLVGCFAGCGLFGNNDDNTTDNTTNNTTDNTTDNTTNNTTVNYQTVDPADAIAHEDYTSVYEVIGSKVTADMVTENDDGVAFVTVDGVKYELGLDFLSMAMVYNSDDEDDYNMWWKLFIQRYNYLALEIPLYSNQYFDLYNAKFEGFVTSPYWGAADAIIATTIKAGESNSAILGSSTELSGMFRNASWGKSSPGSSDLDIQNLTSGYSTVQSDMSGSFKWNMSALASEPVATKNADGTLTYTIEVKSDLKFSDGSAINAKNFIAGLLANSTPVGEAAGGSGASGLNFVGYEEFKAYDGNNAGNDVDGVTASKYFSGIKLLGDYKFSVTILADYANYFYAMSYAGFSPDPMALYLGSNDIITDDNGCCGLSDGFYTMVEKDGAQVYSMADVIKANLAWDSELPYSGPYVVSNYDASSLVATLTLNTYYPGDIRGVASIETITYVKIVSETQMDQFLQGQVDVLAGITGGDETKAALKAVSENPDKYAETHYDRAGYGFLGLRCDVGPTSDTAARQAIMYTINRNEFAQAFTGGFGSVVHGPYYEGFSAYQAVKNDIIINSYNYSSDSAIAVLEEGGWIYNQYGQEFDATKDAVRYKKLEGYALTADNINYKTVDGKYSTVKIDGTYYMPLAINWYGTQPNNVTDMLITAWQANENATTKIGAYITYTSTDFTTGLYGELLHMTAAGWDGVSKLCAINYATGFTSAAYDMSWSFTIDPDLYEMYSRAYFMDEADFYENYTK